MSILHCKTLKSAQNFLARFARQFFYLIIRVFADFALQNTHPDVGGAHCVLSDFASAEALLVAFICNHCPFVIHLRDGLVSLARDYDSKKLSVVAISANDVDTHPADGPEQMTATARENDFGFPYLFDETQAVAQAYQAACTPDFFLFDQNRRLYYRGQFDDSRPNNATPVTGSDLRGAIDTLLSGGAAPKEQKPSIGCNIKWKPGQGPE